MTKHYVYGTRLESKLKKGAPYAYVGDGDFKVVDGEILEIEPEKRLVMSWKAHWGRFGREGSPVARHLRAFRQRTVDHQASSRPR